MAKNKSNLPPLNSLESELERIGKGLERTPITEQRERDKNIRARQQVEAISALPADLIARTPLYNRILNTAPNTVLRTEEYIRHSVDSRHERANQNAVGAVGHQFSEKRTSHVVNQLSSREEVQSQALGKSGGGHSYTQLLQENEKYKRQIDTLSRQASTAAETLFDPNNPNRTNIAGYMSIASKTAVANQIREKMAVNQSTMGILKKQGLDPVSEVERMLSGKQTAESILGKRDITEEIRSSGGIKLKGSDDVVKSHQINTAMILESEKLKKAFQDLTAATEKGEENLTEYSEKIADGVSNLEKLGSVAGAGGGGSKWESGSRIAGAVAGGFYAVAGGIQEVSVNQRLGQKANISGFAGIENQKYDVYKKARSGDVMSQMLLGQFDGAEAFGRELKTGTNIALGAQEIGALAETTSGVAGFIATKNPGDNLLNTSSAMDSRINAIQRTLQGATKATTTGLDLLREVSSSGAQIQGTQADMAARQAVLEIPAAQMQGFRDFSVNSLSAAQMLGGSRGSDFLTRTISDGHLDKMVNSRISPEQFNQMATAGAEQMGSTFNESQIIAAQGMARSGIGTLSQNMQRMATLGAAGSNNPEAGLGSVLEAAFSKGLEGSKVLNMVADNTASMVAGSMSRAAGLDTTAAAAQLLTTGVNSTDPSEVFAVNRAATAREKMDQIGTDTGVNFAAMAATDRISRSLGVSGDEAIILQGLKDQDLMSLRGKSGDEIDTFMVNKGVDIKGDKGQAIETLIKNRLATNFQAGGAGLAQNINVDEMSSLATSGKSFDNLTREQKLKLGKTGSFAGLAGGAEFYQTAGAIVAPTPNSATQERVASVMAGEGGSELGRDLHDLQTSGAMQLSEAARQGAKHFGGAAEALSKLVEAAKLFEKSGGGHEKEFSTAAAESAGDFGQHTKKFGDSVGAFDRAVTRLIEKSGISKDEGAEKAKAAMTSLSEKQGEGQTQKIER